MIAPRVGLVGLLIIQSISIYTAEIITGVAQVDPNYATWYACSDFPTNFTSYSLRVVKNTTAPTPNFGKTAPAPPLPNKKPPKSASVITYQMTEDDLNIYIGTDLNAAFGYVSSLSCFKKPVTQCDQESGKVPLPNITIQCIVVSNPTADPVNFRLIYSFNESAFGQKNFTSPKVPGGNSTTNDTPSSTTGNAPDSNSTPSATNETTGAAGHAFILNYFVSAGALMIGLMAFGLGL